MILIIIHQKKRPQAEDALQHPWFTKWLKERKSASNRLIDKDDHLPIPPDVLRNISQYAKFSPLKKMALMAVAQDLNGPQLIQLQDTFEEIDTNNLGTIDQEEMLQALNGIMSEEDAKNIFKGLDFDKTGKIRYGEFLAAAMDTSKVMEKNQLRVAFNKLDKDNSGSISVPNLIQIAGKVYGEDIIKANLKEFDIKENGVIDFEEFVALMEQKKGVAAASSVVVAGVQLEM